jgi:uncharacterized protein
MPRDPKAARRCYRQAAQSGNAAACLQLGVLYATGNQVRQSYATAARWYAEAAAHGEPMGRYNLAFLHFRGLGVLQDSARGVALLEETAAAGSVAAAMALHRQYVNGEFVTADPRADTHWLVRAAELGSVEATGLVMQRLGTDDAAIPPVERVIELLEACAAHGSTDAQATLGLLYAEGKRIAQDQRLALRWFTRAAQGGNAFAQAWLGDVLIRGIGLPVDRDAAMTWYERAAIQGHAGAIAALTSLRLAGSDRDKLKQVFELWLRAAEQGSPQAQRVVGDFYLRGVGTEASIVEARRWLMAAARQEHVPAMVLLGSFLL